MASETEEQEVQPLIQEVDSIRAWRREELTRAGYNDDLAQVLGHCLDIDLHRAIELVRDKGCKPSVAALILL